MAGIEATARKSMETRPPDVTPLTLCDREPIRIPGAIQPHGLLLVCDRDDLTVIGGAGALEHTFGPDWLGRPLTRLIAHPLADKLAAARLDHPVFTGRLAIRDGVEMDASILLSGDRLLVQLEPAGEGWQDTAGSLMWLEGMAGAFERAIDLRELCNSAADVFREITGFDRVMVYKFLDDDSGVVVAEARAEGLHSFLHHHFPATDIPVQARSLYIRNRVRVIPDVAYAPAPLRPDDRGLQALDLSDMDLRSVSPIHVQYLKNMGVAASASISIVKDGVLWGLIACHNHTPRGLSQPARLACQTLGAALARQVRAKEEAETYRERLRLRLAEDTALARLAAQPDASILLGEAADDLCRMIDADGFAVVGAEGAQCAGHCPDIATVKALAAWVRDGGHVLPVRTASLDKLYPGARAYQDVASGLLGLVIYADDPIVLLWFRAEARQIVEWAGNPHKDSRADPMAELTPRASFEAWTEEVRGRARPWTAVEVEAAQRLSRGLAEARQGRRIRELNRQLSATVAEKDKLLVQKEHLLREVNHRIQNSLQLVAAFLSMQARAEKNEALTAHLGEAQRRLSAVALVHRRLYSDDNTERVDLARYLEELIGEMKISMGEAWSAGVALDLAPVSLPADAAVNVGLILTELIINATKYAYGGQPGPVSIAVEQHGSRFRLIVADRGVGKSGARQGFGSRMISAMVESLGGALEDSDNRPGLRVIVTAPIPPG